MAEAFTWHLAREVLRYEAVETQKQEAIVAMPQTSEKLAHKSVPQRIHKDTVDIHDTMIILNNTIWYNYTLYRSIQYMSFFIFFPPFFHIVDKHKQVICQRLKSANAEDEHWQGHPEGHNPGASSSSLRTWKDWPFESEILYWLERCRHRWQIQSGKVSTGWCSATESTRGFPVLVCFTNLSAAVEQTKTQGNRTKCKTFKIQNA